MKFKLRLWYIEFDINLKQHAFIRKLFVMNVQVEIDNNVTIDN